MGQIHMGRESPFTAFVACFTAGQLPLLREAVDVRRYHDAVGVGTLTGAAAAYWLNPKCPGRGSRGVWRNGPTAAGVP